MKSFAPLLALLVASACATNPWCVPYPVGNTTVTLDPARSLRLVAIGDAGDAWARKHPDFPPADLAAAISAATKDRQPDAILVLGDNFYPCGVNPTDVAEAMDTVYRPLFDLNVPMYAVLGNHDYSEGGEKCGKHDRAAVRPQAQVDYRGGTWHMPARNYVLRWPGLVSIVMYDSEPVRRQCGVRDGIVSFVRDRVAGIPAGEWRLAAAHHALYSSGSHGQNPDDAGTMRAALLSTFAGHLDLYLAGHDHDIERFDDKSEPVFVVSGSASKVREDDPEPDESDLQAGPAPPGFFAAYGFAVIDLTAAKATVRLYDAENKKWLDAKVISH